MFKSILPSKRSPVDGDFSLIPSQGDTAVNGKENLGNLPTAPKVGSNSKATKAPLFSEKQRRKKSFDHSTQRCETNLAFDRLLDELQIPDSLRPKLLGMEANVKEAMLKSSQTITMALPPAPTTPPSIRSLRRVHSGSSLSIESPRPQRVTSSFYQQPSMAVSGFSFANAQRHAHGSSMDLVRPKSRGAGLVDGAAKGSREKSSAKNPSPVQFVSQLTGTSSLTLSVDIVKKLRLMLRNEAASWTQEFLKSGGYSALLTRLNELLEVEWREEQHDDQLLHELLRCMKALSTSSIGCFALRSSCPTPFVQLVTLLYSDKKPGDVATRQLIVELMLLLFDLYPVSALSAAGTPSGRRSNPDAIVLPYPHTTLFGFIRSLLLTHAPAPAEAPETTVSPHEFIESLHRPRLYKSYLQELSDICRDYFWVFCHPNNAIWILAETDEGKVEKPKAPGGMTGGVEFEAMGYMTTQFRFLNAIAKIALEGGLPKDDPMSAYQLHSDLFLSGLERVLLIARKASATYYPTLHLEIARYAALAAQARFDLPWTVERLMGPPPTGLGRRIARPPTIGTTGIAGGSPQPSPTKRSGAGTPGLPMPRHLEQTRFD